MTFPSAHPALGRALVARGYSTPTAVQLAVLEADTAGRDLLEKLQNQFKNSDDVKFRQLRLGQPGIPVTIIGIEGMTVDPKRAVLPRGRPVEELPTINPDGTIEIPKDDGLPGSKQTGIPVVPADNKNQKKQNRRRPRGSP